jgi:peptidoglycan/xylan/chitin deacetylase (PgdA/CDA1 family)
MVLLSFDIEEFDVPAEHGVQIPLQEQIEVSRQGTCRILEILAANNVKATFFCTATFAIHAPQIIQKIKDGGHEIASHGYYHSAFKVSDLEDSRKKLEEISGCKILGYRMARMMPVDEREIFNAGYVYNSSINPTFIPGRYNNFGVSRTWFMRDGVMQIPASVSPVLRFPLFWLSFHNLPQWLYRFFAARALKKDGYLNIYFHPWEFADIKKREYNLPYIIVHNSGADMVRRVDAFIKHWKERGESFGTLEEFVKLKTK